MNLNDLVLVDKNGKKLDFINPNDQGKLNERKVGSGLPLGIKFHGRLDINDEFIDSHKGEKVDINKREVEPEIGNSSIGCSFKIWGNIFSSFKTPEACRNLLVFRKVSQWTKSHIDDFVAYDLAHGVERNVFNNVFLPNLLVSGKYSIPLVYFLVARSCNNLSIYEAYVRAFEDHCRIYAKLWKRTDCYSYNYDYLDRSLTILYLVSKDSALGYYCNDKKISDIFFLNYFIEIGCLDFIKNDNYFGFQRSKHLFMRHFGHHKGKLFFVSSYLIDYYGKLSSHSNSERSRCLEVLEFFQGLSFINQDQAVKLSKLLIKTLQDADGLSSLRNRIEAGALELLIGFMDKNLLKIDAEDAAIFQEYALRQIDRDPHVPSITGRAFYLLRFLIKNNLFVIKKISVGGFTTKPLAIICYLKEFSEFKNNDSKKSLMNIFCVFTMLLRSNVKLSFKQTDIGFLKLIVRDQDNEYHGHVRLNALFLLHHIIKNDAEFLPLVSEALISDVYFAIPPYMLSDVSCLVPFYERCSSHSNGVIRNVAKKCLDIILRNKERESF